MDFSIGEFDNENWRSAEEISIKNYWSGEKAIIGRHAAAKLLWSETAFYVRFEANQAEPLIISEEPNLKSKPLNLWDRDVCEIFVAPDGEKPEKYFEFEIAPNGEWIDLAIRHSEGRRETDFDYNSGMRSSAKIQKDKNLMAMKIEWKAFGKTPKTGNIWRGNLFRCVGSGANRGYLAWQPTKTEKPNFHIPQVFGEFKFVG